MPKSSQSTSYCAVNSVCVLHKGSYCHLTNPYPNWSALLVQVEYARSCCVATMTRVSSWGIGVLRLFKQLVQSFNGRHENDLEINTLRPACVRFNWKICQATWCVDNDWNEIEFACSYTGRLQTGQRPWRCEKYTRILQMF